MVAQGFAVHKLDFSVLSDRELGGLAGNSMHVRAAAAAWAVALQALPSALELVLDILPTS